MDFSPSPRAADLTSRVKAFIDDVVAPVEASYHADLDEQRRTVGAGGDPWRPLPVVEELKAEARARGLWNLFLPPSDHAEHAAEYAARFGTDGGEGLSNVDYAPIAELTGRSHLAPLVMNCNAPDTGNMEVLLRYGSAEQRATWLEPLLDGTIRSAFAMTEPDVASSDATNMAATAVVDGDEMVINGRKWWSTGVGHPDCKVFVFMGLTDPDADRHHRHSMVLVPRDAPGVKVERMLNTMGYYDEPLGHGEVSFNDVRVPLDNVIGGPGEAFSIAQGRLGPGRVHHCMRLIGLAEMALELACRRSLERTAFGKPIANLGGNRERIAEARIAIDSTRLLVLNAAWKLDVGGPLNALSEVAQIKVAAPTMAQKVIDMAMQLHGGRWPLRRPPARGSVDDGPSAAPGRRSRRGAPRRHRPARARQVRRRPMSETPDGNPAKPVRDEDAFDVEAVAAWLDRGPIAEVRQFAGGASNLTYLLRYDAPVGAARPDPAPSAGRRQGQGRARHGPRARGAEGAGPGLPARAGDGRPLHRRRRDRQRVLRDGEARRRHPAQRLPLRAAAGRRVDPVPQRPRRARRAALGRRLVGARAGRPRQGRRVRRAPGRRLDQALRRRPHRRHRRLDRHHRLARPTTSLPTSRSG